MTNANLETDATLIDVTARDLMLVMKRIVPCSERSSFSGIDPLRAFIEYLLTGPLEQLKICV